MSPKQQFMATAEAAGIEVEYEPGCAVRSAYINVWAPRGMVFNGSGCHVDSSIGALNKSGKSVVWPEAKRQLNAIIAHGFSECPDLGECEYCDEVEV